MPHLRTSSVSSSIQNLIRKSSLFGSKANLEHTECEENTTQAIIHLPALGPNGHVHMLPPVPAGVQMDESIVDWMSRIADSRPEVVISSSPKSFHVNESHLTDIEPGSVTLNPAASLLFLRVLNTKLYGASEKLPYQLSISVGSALQSTSCPSSTKTGDLYEWFLIDLNQGVSVDDCWIEIAISRPEKEPKHKSIRKILGLNMGSKSQAASAQELPSAAGGKQLQRVSHLRIPLLSVAFSSDDRFPKPWGTYYLTDCESSNRILGEITFDITESPESFTLSPLLSKSAKTEAKFTAPLTVLRSEGRVAYWQRITGSIANRELIAFDFQRNTGSSLWTRSLKQVSALDFSKHHPMSIDNVIELTFATGEKMFAYADDEKGGLKWADKLSMAVWGQPFTLEGESNF